MKFAPEEMKKRGDRFGGGVLFFFIYSFVFLLCASVATIIGEFMPKYARAIHYGVWGGSILINIVCIFLIIYNRKRIKKARKKIADNTLLIGIVRCKNCGSKWEVLSIKLELMKLECPVCHAHDSEPVGGKNEKKQKESF